jgi:hypothetical protein
MLQYAYSTCVLQVCSIFKYSSAKHKSKENSTMFLDMNPTDVAAEETEVTETPEEVEAAAHHDMPATEEAPAA